jgi:peptide/nickel transport system permease protein
MATMQAAGHLQKALFGIRLDPGIWIPVAVLAALIGLSLVGPLLWTVDPLQVDVSASLQPPSRLHPMGTDGVGRDVFARFIAGAQISLVVGMIVVVIGALIGGLSGLVAGALGGKVDNVLMRVMDAILAFPPLILAMAVTVGLGVGIRTAAIGIIVPSIPWYARIIRSDVIRVRGLPFVEAAAAIGASRTRIIRFHILPHVFSTLIIQAAVSFGYSVLSLASLGFIGLGAQIPTPEWGAMITDGLHYALTGRWWIGLFPGLGLLLAITAANSLADRARDLLDPRNTAAPS